MGRRDFVVAALRPLCKDRDARTRRVLAQTVLAIGEVGWLSGNGGADLVRFLIAQCGADREGDEAQAEAAGGGGAPQQRRGYFSAFTGKGAAAATASQAATNGGGGIGSGGAAPGAAQSPAADARAAAEAALAQLARCPQAEPALWPLLLEELLTPQATPAARSVLEACSVILKRRMERLSGLSGEAILGPGALPAASGGGSAAAAGAGAAAADGGAEQHPPPPLTVALLARLTVLLHSASGRSAAAAAALELLPLLSPLYTGRTISPDGLGGGGVRPLPAPGQPQQPQQATLAASLSALSATASRLLSLGATPSPAATNTAAAAATQSPPPPEQQVDDVGDFWCHECPALAAWLAGRAAASTGRDGVRRWRAADQAAWDDVVLEFARRRARCGLVVHLCDTPLFDAQGAVRIVLKLHGLCAAPPAGAFWRWRTLRARAPRAAAQRRP